MTEAQWAIHTGRGFEFPVISSHVYHFHATPGRTNHLHAARLDDCGGDGRTQEKRKPHQHQFGDEFGAAQGVHSAIMTKVNLAPVELPNLKEKTVLGKVSWQTCSGRNGLR